MMKTSFHATDDGVTIHRQQDVSGVLEFVHSAREAGAFKGADMHYCAEFPPVVIENYMHQWGVTYRDVLQDPVHVRRMMADPALAGFVIKNDAKVLK